MAIQRCHRPLAHLSLYKSCLSPGARSGRRKFEYCPQRLATPDSNPRLSDVLEFRHVWYDLHYTIILRL